MDIAAYFIVVVLLLFFIAKTFSGSFKVVKGLVLNCLLGIILLLAVNFIGGYYNFFIGINAVTVLVSGFCGVPGVAFLVLFKIFL